jgi:hypothetical protein
MTQIAESLSRITGCEIDAEALKPLLIFSAIGLAVSLLAMLTYGSI